jgi:hypothetical protein
MYFDLAEQRGTPNQQAIDLVPVRLLFGDDAVGGRGRDRVRAVTDTSPADRETAIYQFNIPDEVLEALGYDPDDAHGEYLSIAAGDGSCSIAIEPPTTKLTTYTLPRLKQQYGLDSTEEYITVLQTAADETGSPFTVRKYRTWKANTDTDTTAPTVRKIMAEFGSFPAACEAAEIET